jgi:4-amino-4-deoxy-L-arabinose transferase-like glycosyltransferase
LLHLDGLVSNLIFLALLAFLCYLFKGRRLVDLVLAILATGFAWLTKSTAILLVPMFILMVTIDLIRHWRTEGTSHRKLVWLSIWPLILWLVGSAAIFVALWPSMWVDPMGTMARMFQTTFGYATRGHPSNIFFNGQVIDGDPGWLFYPISFLWRTTPAVLIGLGLVLIAIVFRKDPMDDPDRRLPALYLVMWILIYIVIMSLGAKKFDRYLLPAIPSIDILAGLGWMALVSWIVNRWSRPVSYLIAGGILVLVIGSQVFLTVQTYPYFLSYYNPLLGGSARAPQVMMIGWGEGLDQAGRYLESLPQADSLQVMTNYPDGSVSYFFDGKLRDWPSTWKGVEALRDRGVDFLVLYIGQRQRRNPDQSMMDYFARQIPEFTARINGIDYAKVYNLRKLRP